jgi:hypothetical protein
MADYRALIAESTFQNSSKLIIILITYDCIVFNQQGGVKWGNGWHENQQDPAAACYEGQPVLAQITKISYEWMSYHQTQRGKGK